MLAQHDLARGSLRSLEPPAAAWPTASLSLRASEVAHGLSRDW
jgi:hypothetical protein